MSSAGRELHAAGPGDALPAQRPASAAPCAAPGTAAERPASTLPPEPHGWTLGACEPSRRPPLAPGEAPRPEEQQQQQEMRGGGLERPGWCEGGPRLPSCGAKGRPGEKEFQPIQKGREHVASPSCLEMKDLLQNLEESPAKVPVASEKQSGLPKEEAPGMKADGTGLCCNAGEPRAQARTGALLEASPCSGGVVVSGSNRLVSPEPPSPSSAKGDEEVPTSARQMEGEAFQNPGQGTKAVWNSRPSIQQGTFGPPGDPSLALALDVGPRGPRLEGQALQGSSLGRTSWGDCVDLSQVACEVQEGTFKSNPSGGRMEDLGEAAESPLQAGSPGRELSNNEPKGGGSMDLFSSPVHKGMIRIQKGSAGHSCWKGEGEHFPSKHSMFLSPAEPLVAPKDQERHSDIGRFSLCDGVQAALEDELRVRSSEASRIQEDKSSSLRHEKWITLGQRNGALLSKRHNLGSFQNSCSIKYVSTSLSCWAPQLDFGGKGLPLRVDNLGTAFPLCDLALPQWATSSFCVFADEKSLKVLQLCGPSPFAQKADPSSGHGGPMDSLSPEGVIVMQNPGAWPHHKEAFAPSQASGRLQARMNEGAWEMVRWVLRGAENGEVAMEAFWRKALRLRVRAVNDLPSAPEEIYALARNLFLDCRHLQESKIAFSLGISPALLESSGRFTSLPKKFSCSPYRNNWVGLDRAGRPLNSVYPLEVPCFSLSKAEAEKWSINGGDAFEGSESILERKGDIFPPYERVEVHKASHGDDAGGMKTGNATGCSNTRLSLQRAFDGDLSKTPLLCRATFRKSQCLEEQEKYQSHPSSPASNLSHLNRKDSSLCTKCSALQREPIYQMKIFLHPCYSLDSCTLFEQKNDSPKTEFLECQQPSLIFYKKLNYHDLQTVIRSVIKYVRCNKNKSLHSKRELKVTPSATTALLTEYQGPFHKIITESSNNNTGSEFTGNLPNEDLLQSQSPRTLSRSSASESLNRNDFVKKWAPRSKTHDLHSASESIHKRPSGKFNFEKGLLSARKLVSSPFQTGPAATSAQIKGQERMKGLLLKPYRKRKILSLLSAGLGSQFPQNKKMCLLPKEAALASPSHGSPLAQRHCRVSLPRERGAGLESKKESSSPGRDAAAACSLLSRRTGQHFKGPRVEALVSLYPLEQPLEDLEADPREAGRTAGMMEGFPVRILSDTEVSSEALLGNLLLPLGAGQVTFPLKAAIHTGLPLGLPEDFSESDSGKAKDSPEPPVTWRQVESPSCAPQAELFLSLRKQAEALGSSVPSSSSSGLKGGSFAGFPPWPSVKEGHPLRVERGQGLAGGPGEGPEGHLVDEHRRRGDSEAGAQPPAPKEKPPVGRRPALGEPAGNSSGEKAEGLGELARSTWTSLGRAGQKRRQQEPPAHMQKESKRQKRGQGCGEPASLNLPFWNRCRQACWPSSVGAFGPFPPAVGCDQSRSPGVFGYLRLQRPFPAFRKLSRAACIKAGMPRRLRAPKPLASKGELVYSAQSATEPAAPQPVVLWDPPVKQQGHSSSSLAVSWLAGQPKDAALLTRLSQLAEELLFPACRPFLPRRALLPPAAKWGPQRRKRKRRLLEIFSLVSLRLSSPPWLSSCCFKMAGSQALPVYSVESTVLCFFELSSDPPCRCSPPGVSPLPFHHQMDIGPPGKLPEAGSPSLVPMFPLRGPQPQPPSAWSLFFLLPQGCLDAMLIQKDAEPGSASARKEGEAVAHSPGCPTPGLPSALALFSPSCYRAWTRRRRYPSGRTPAAQRLSLLHFARGFKGLQDCASVPAGLFSALPSLLGSVLSTWSQQRPSIHLSESTPLHSGPSRGPPALPATASLSHRTSPSLPPLVPGLPSDPSGAVKNDVRLESILSVLLPTSCQGPEPAHPPLGFPALGSGDGHEASVPALPKTGAQLAKDKSENRPKKVSQIRIRKTIPKPDPNLTPMGLPRPKRLKKTEFSLEEIYTNQNYKSPPATRCLETIFEEPKEKNGSLISISHQKRKRILEFQDFTVPRKRRARSRVRVTGGSTRAQKAAGEGRELDVLLIQKLADLETFFAKEETQEQASSCS